MSFEPQILSQVVVISPDMTHTLYLGQWQLDKMVGCGVFKYASGTTYEGELYQKYHHNAAVDHVL